LLTIITTDKYIEVAAQQCPTFCQQAQFIIVITSDRSSTGGCLNKED